jgi:hypothetical protein
VAVIKWATPATSANALTTELNSLANAATSAASAAIDNATDKYLYMAVDVTLASLTPTAGGYLAVYLLPAVDGTNYSDITQSQLVATLALTTTASAKRVSLGNIPIPPFSFKLALENRSGVALGASGNVLATRRYNEEVA